MGVFEDVEVFYALHYGNSRDVTLSIFILCVVRHAVKLSRSSPHCLNGSFSEYVEVFYVLHYGISRGVALVHLVLHVVRHAVHTVPHEALHKLLHQAPAVGRDQARTVLHLKMRK